MSHSTIVGAVEIGTAKIVVAVGQIVNNQSLNIIGVGHVTSQGLKKGEVIDFKAASTATHAAIMDAEESAGVHLENVLLAQTGAHLEGFLNEASVNVTSSNNYVSQDDIKRVSKEAKTKDLSPDRVYIHHIQNPFKLDGRLVSNPLGMQGEKLHVGYWSIHGDLSKVRDNIHIINGFGLKVEDVIVSSIAAGAMTTNETEKMNGALVLDVGRGTTDFIVYRSGYVICTGVLPVGGDHITNDISLGLRIDRNQAESLKVDFGRATMENSSNEKIGIESDASFGKRSVERNAIYQIINARVKELYALVRSKVETALQLSDLSAGVILTGGASQLPGIDAVAQEVFGLDVRLGDNPAWACDALREPEYSTVLGLLHYALRTQEQLCNAKSKKQGIFNKVSKVFNIKLRGLFNGHG